MPGFPAPSSGGFAEKSPGGSAQSKQPGKTPYGGQSGGSVMISGPEEKALRVLELDDPDDPNDDTQLLQQASAESGLPLERVQKLQMRAESARNKGMTLKGPTITFQPINPQMEDGLLGDPMADVGGDPMNPDGQPDPWGDQLDSLTGKPAAGGPGMQAGAAAAVPVSRTGTGRPAMAGPGAPPAPGSGLQAGPQGVGVVTARKAQAPAGGSVTTGATMSSAGMSNQRFAPSWRPHMSQATMAPPRMSPDLNRAGGAPPAPGAKPVVGTPTGAPQRGAGLPPAKRPLQRPLSGGGMTTGFGQVNSRDPRLAAAYAREARVEECDECGGTCGGKKKRYSR